MRPIRTVKAVEAAAQFESLGKPLSRHRAITRVTVAAFSFTLLIALSAHPPAQAGPQQAPVPPEPLLPATVGVAVDPGASITIPFETSMTPASVEESLQVLPAQAVELTWNPSHTRLTITPERRWRGDERYLVVLAGTPTNDGAAPADTSRYTFTTETAPAVTEFQVHLADAPPAPEPPEAMLSVITEADPAAADALTAVPEPIGDGAAVQDPSTTQEAVSPSSSIAFGFSEEMDPQDVAEHFAILPHVEGDLAWTDGYLVFSPTGKMEPGARYTISVAGAHDAEGDVLGGQESFSFIVQSGAQLTKSTPERGATDVEAAVVEMWFSRPMDEDATNAAFALIDTATAAPVGGHLTWNDKRTKITFVPDRSFAGGRTYAVTLAKGAKDVDGNSVRTEWSFTTKTVAVAAAPVRSTTTTRSAPTVPPPAPATSLAGYALNQVNAARSAYGVAPLVLDASISAVAASHAMDQARNNYFSHYGLDGSTREVRLARGGVSFGWSGENQCYHVGMSQTATLNWCHAQFMAEPYPGHWNHIANILNPNARRMGVGIATVGDKTVITWDFTD